MKKYQKEITDGTVAQNKWANNLSDKFIELAEANKDIVFEIKNKIKDASPDEIERAIKKILSETSVTTWINYYIPNINYDTYLCSGPATLIILVIGQIRFVCKEKGISQEEYIKIDGGMFEDVTESQVENWVKEADQKLTDLLREEEAKRKANETAEEKEGWESLRKLATKNQK
jgi:hypothetical protein